ncbi:hypothetical protein [Phytohalomonas tamaricis]|uniref:hypothetical protein n=1 Tax=Phytohalomonas tamaricis TaxID=2081032 RepID=UPI001319BE13|nr:hypothetical protein [Phytohalomonas tamaricis]
MSVVLHFACLIEGKARDSRHIWRYMTMKVAIVAFLCLLGIIRKRQCRGRWVLGVNIPGATCLAIGNKPLLALFL